MELSVAQGQTVRLPADFRAGDLPADPENPTLDILTPSESVAVRSAAPSRAGLGSYYYDFKVAADAPVGVWKARWNAVLEGRPVAGEDSFEVLPGVIVSPAQPAPPAPGSQPRGPKATAVASAPEEDDAETTRRVTKGPSATRTRRTQSSKARPHRRTRSRPRLRARRSVLFLAVALALVAAAIFFAGRDSGSQPDSSFGMAEAALREGRLDEGRSIYLDILERDPGNKLAYYNLGMLAQLQGRPAESEDYYLRSLRRDPDFFPALYNLATLKQALGANAEAELLYTKALELNPEHAPSHYNLGLIYLRTGRPTQGEAEIDRAVELDPSLQGRDPTPVPAETPS